MASISHPLIFAFLTGILMERLFFWKLNKKISSLFVFLVIGIIGFRAGNKLFETGFNERTLQVVLFAFILSLFLAYFLYKLFKRWEGAPFSLALSACYGSISITTFVASVSFGESQGIVFSPQVVTSIPFMEFPPILLSLFLYRRETQKIRVKIIDSMYEIFKERGFIVLLLSFAAGYLLGSFNEALPYGAIEVLFQISIFVYLFDAGSLFGLCLRNGAPRFTDALFALFIPLFSALILFIFAHFLSFTQDDTFFLMVLFASASYVIAPAMLRAGVPEAPFERYFSMVLMVTFPFNVLIGIPLYFKISFW